MGQPLAKRTTLPFLEGFSLGFAARDAALSSSGPRWIGTFGPHECVRSIAVLETRQSLDLPPKTTGIANRRSLRPPMASPACQFCPNGFPNGFPNETPNGIPNGVPNGFPNGFLNGFLNGSLNGSLHEFSN